MDRDHSLMRPIRCVGRGRRVKPRARCRPRRGRPLEVAVMGAVRGIPVPPGLAERDVPGPPHPLRGKPVQPDHPHLPVLVPPPPPLAGNLVGVVGLGPSRHTGRVVPNPPLIDTRRHMPDQRTDPLVGDSRAMYMRASVSLTEAHPLRAERRCRGSQKRRQRDDRTDRTTPSQGRGQELVQPGGCRYATACGGLPSTHLGGEPTT